MTDERRPKINTVCPDCQGDRVIYKSVLYANGTTTGSVSVPVPCKTCKGKGRLPGLQPPV